MRTVQNNTLEQLALQSQTVQTGTVNGAAIDTAVFGNNFRDVKFILTSGTLTDGSYAVTVEESDSSGSGYAVVASSRVIGSLPTFAAADDHTVKAVGARPTKRYTRVVVTATGATTGGVLSGVAVLGNGSNNPVSRA